MACRYYALLAILGLVTLTSAFAFAPRRVARPSSLQQAAASPRSLAEVAQAGVVGRAASVTAAVGALVVLVPKKVLADDEKAFIDALATIVSAKAIVGPIDGYIKARDYDAGRTNVKYLLNQLRIEKASTSLIKGALEFGNPDGPIDDAQEAAANMGNYVIQLDSTIYTVIFIPSDDSGGVPPAAEKYLVMCTGYLNNLTKALELLMSLGTTEQLAQAKKQSDAQLASLAEKAILFKKIARKTSI